MAQPSEAYREAKSFFHALSKVNTEISQYVYESSYKSAHTVRGKDIWTDEIPYSIDFLTSDNWVIANPSIGHKYNLVDLTEIAGSNGQAWYLNDGGTFIDKWIAPTDVPNLVTKSPSFGFQLRLYQSDGVTIIPPAVGVWNIDYYAGIVLFQNGQTPNDLGYGIPKAIIYNYVGNCGTGSDSSSLSIIHTAINLIVDNSHSTIICDTTLNTDLIISLPTSADVFNDGKGQIFRIKNNGTGRVIINPIAVLPSGTEKIDEMEGYRYISSNGDSLTIQADGIGWYLL